MNLNRHSPGPPSTSTATRIIGPKPFYRSRITPDPFDYSNSDRRQNDYQHYLPSQSHRRNSVNQMNGKKSNSRNVYA